MFAFSIVKITLLLFRIISFTFIKRSVKFISRSTIDLKSMSAILVKFLKIKLFINLKVITII